MRLPTLLVLNVAVCISLAVPACAQPRVGGIGSCTPASLSGSYGYAISGFDGVVPVANYGFFTSNGSGSFTGSATVSIGGTITPITFSGQYTLNAACTGTSVFQDSLGTVAHFAFTVNANGGVLEFVQTDSGTVVSGRAQPLAPTCDLTAFSGPYTYAISGWVAFAGTYVPYAEAGRIVADGKGNFTGKSTFSAGGVVQRRTLSATYSISSACTGSISLTDNLGNSAIVKMAVVDNGQQVLFINATAGTVISGRVYRGQYSCSNESVSGPYSYSVTGFGVAPGALVPVAYSGLVTADGNGSLQGSDAISQGGVVRSRTVSASYTVNSDCSGSEVVKDSLGETAAVDFFVTDQGGQVEFIQTDSGLVISGEGQHQASATCSNATINGSYGYALEGWFSPLEAVADAGQITADGAGHFSGVTTSSFGGQIEPRSLTGTYQTNADCSGTSMFHDSLGNTANFRFTVTPDGQQIDSVELDSGTIVTSFLQYQFAQPTAAIVNAASFATDLAPGSLISIFGSGFASGVTQATNTPWPTQLGSTTVSVNGKAIPAYYVSPGQVNAQLPVDLAPGAAQLTVSASGATSSPVSFTVSAAAPGIFTYGLLRAIAVNPNGSLNGPSSPAHAGDELVVYLTGGGAVQPTGGTWITGSVAPPGASPVSSPNTVTLGGLPVVVDYLGLTPSFIGLYQLNLRVPSLPTGDHTLTITENGKSSASALVSIAQ